MRRRLMLKNSTGVSPVLPAEYQRVEYIARSVVKNAYIVTPQFSGYITKVMVDIEKTVAPSSGTIVVGKFTGSSVTSPFGTIEGNNASQGNFLSTPSIQIAELLPRDVYTLTTTETGLTDRACLFGWNNTGWVAGFKAWGIKLYNNTNALVFDGVPCYRKSDSKIGLFDFVSQTFCVTVGNGWTKGADI